MTKITQKFLEEQLEILKNDGIPEDLIQRIREKIKDEDLVKTLL